MIDLIAAIVEFVESWRRARRNEDTVNWLVKSEERQEEDLSRLQTEIDRINAERMLEAEKLAKCKSLVDQLVNDREVLEAKINRAVSTSEAAINASKKHG